MLVGIGCNVMTAPNVETSGENNGRPSTCLADHMQNCEIEISGSNKTCASNVTLHEIHKEIAAEIFGALSSYTKQPYDSAAAVILDFERYMNFSPQKLRNANSAGDDVIPLRINVDGTLQVNFVDIPSFYTASFLFEIKYPSTRNKGYIVFTIA